LLAAGGVALLRFDPFGAFLDFLIDHGRGQLALFNGEGNQPLTAEREN
jgi:hypothetical protein